MSRLTDLAIKKLAMRKEAGHRRYWNGETDFIPCGRTSDFGPIQWADLYARHGYAEPTRYKYSPDPNSPYVDPEALRIGAEQLRSHPFLEDSLLISDTVEPSRLNPESMAYPTKTGYLDSRSANVYRQILLAPANYDDRSEILNSINPVVSRLAYPGSAAEARDKRMQQGLDNVNKRERMAGALVGNLGGTAMGRLYGKSQPKK